MAWEEAAFLDHHGDVVSWRVAPYPIILNGILFEYFYRIEKSS